MMTTTTSSSRRVKPRGREQEAEFIAWTTRAVYAAPGHRLKASLRLRGRDDVELRLGGRNLDRIDGFACLGGRTIDDEPLAGGEHADVVPTEQAVGADAVAPRNPVEGLTLPHDVHHSSPARRALDRRAKHGRQRLGADPRSLEGQQQLEARADSRARGDAVRELELGERDGVFRREPVEAVAPFHRVRLPGGERLVVGVEVPPE